MNGTNKWDAVISVLTGHYALAVLVTIVVLVLLLILAARSGWITVNTRHVKFGIADREREIVRNQQQWVRYFVMGLAGKFPSEDGYNGYRIKYILKCITEKVEDWITYNHISDKDSYLHIKQSELRNFVYSEVSRDEFMTEEFAKHMDKWTEEIIHNLLMIREEYK